VDDKPRIHARTSASSSLTCTACISSFFGNQLQGISPFDIDHLPYGWWGFLVWDVFWVCSSLYIYTHYIHIYTLYIYIIYIYIIDNLEMPSAVVKHGKKWGVVGMSLNVMFLYIKWQYWGIKGNIERIIWDIYSYNGICKTSWWNLGKGGSH
jgi:hypothetical protein